jgi:MraZ protein
MLRGNSPAKVDDKGRIKIPTLFRKFLEDTYGRDCFVTSLTGEFVRIYPMPVWLEVEKKIAAHSSVRPPMARFRNFVNYYGQAASMDDQGRILIHPLLRLKSGIDGEVAVLGNLTCLDIWNREKFEAMLASQPLSDEDLKDLSHLGI